MNTLVKSLEERLLIPFENLAKRLSNQFPNVGARAYSHSTGSLTDYQGYGFYVDCIITGAGFDDVDNVALCVGLMHLTTKPKIEAYVCWGYPSGYVEAEFMPDWVEVSDEVLEKLYADLPRLYNALIEAVRRRKPPQ